MTITSPWIGSVAAWLLEVYGFATILLIVAGLAMLALKQPADRLTVARATFVALALLGPLVAVCRSVRSSTLFEPTPNEFCCPSDRSKVTPTEPLQAAIVGLFAIGSGLAAGWLALGAVASTRLLRRSRPAPTTIRAILARVAGQGGVPPRLLVGSGAAQPVAFGLIRPAIILPEWFVEGEPDPRIELALAHEWAHFENGDLRLLALSRALLPLLFAHPLFAWLRRQVRADQEALADLAASRREGRIAYAEALLDWARSGQPSEANRMMPALGLWDRSTRLRRRIALLLDGDFRLEARCSPRWRAAVGALTFASLVGLGGVAASGPVAGPSRSQPHTHPSTLPISLEGRSNVVLCCPLTSKGQ
jgi:beta-lactamase regulating signal transducer with metallopeptidase domain